MDFSFETGTYSPRRTGCLEQIDAIRFLKLFDNGSGNYTAERDRWLNPISLEEILADIQQRQNT